MRHFKLPLIATAIVFVLAIGVGVFGLIKIDRSGKSNQEKKERAELLGGGVATLVCFIIFPFWIFAAAKVGKERRAALEAKKQAAAGGGES
ncbi:hypothetical protein LBMAG56_52110 [Verrucomicrobiota bacterium]|nr:hypothetical protein LBMAG56_52110 [Verrucomicrobiota bacterium]